MNTSLTRNLAYWLLLILSVASAAIGAWLITGQIGTMTTRLLDGTATNVEVYVGPSIVLVGAALLGAGVIGILLALVLAAAKALLPAPAPVAEVVDVAAPADVASEPEADAAESADGAADTADSADDTETESAPVAEPAVAR